MFCEHENDDKGKPLFVLTWNLYQFFLGNQEVSIDIIFMCIIRNERKLWAYVELHDDDLQNEKGKTIKRSLLLSICDDLNVFWHKRSKKAKT